MATGLFERFITAARCAGVPMSKALTDSLRERLSAAELATPDVAADPNDFVAGLCAALAAATDPSHELSQLHVEDMYFAWALAKGERSAFARFEREFLARLPSQMGMAETLFRAELEQNVRIRLFVPSGDRPPRIAQYVGRGPFGAWLRMIAKRAALDMHRARGNAAPPVDLASPSVPTNPELDYLKLRYAAEFKQALEQALKALDAHQVTLLKLSSLEQLSAATIGVMYGVSSRTVQRWLLDVREAVLTRTRRALEARLSITPKDLDSLLGLMQSQLQVSLQRILDAKTPESI